MGETKDWTKFYSTSSSTCLTDSSKLPTTFESRIAGDRVDIADHGLQNINELSLPDFTKLKIFSLNRNACMDMYHSNLDLLGSVNFEGDGTDSLKTTYSTTPVQSRTKAVTACLKCRENRHSFAQQACSRTRRSISLPCNFTHTFSTTLPDLSKDTELEREEPVTTRFESTYKKSERAVEAQRIRVQPIWCDLTTSKKSTASSAMQQHSYLSLGARISSLFTFGVILALVMNFLQKQRRVTIFSPGLFGDVLNSAWWIPPLFGIGSIAVGLLYPFLDEVIGKKKSFGKEWSSVMRCIALFVGINHASAKINFDSNIHLSLVLGALSIGLWYFFDQSWLGLGLGIATMGVATFVTQLLVALNVFGYSDPDFLYIRSWVPWLYFSGGITVGNVGRALAALHEEPTKQHID